MENKSYKIIAIGDIHGRTCWEKIVKLEKRVKKIVFIGDYFDSKDLHSTEEQILNFIKILEFKRKHMDKVVLLLGNHDFHYLKDAQEKYSGFQTLKFLEINKFLEPAVQLGLVVACYTYENYVFTHAGVTNTWCENNNIDVNDLSNSINKTLLENPSAFRFSMGINYDSSGDDVTQSPIWVRIPSLFKDMLSDKIFVFGHTTLKELTIIDNMIGIDVLGTSGEYLLIENGCPKPKKLC